MSSQRTTGDFVVDTAVAKAQAGSACTIVVTTPTDKISFLGVDV
jgi:hypothetical protein